jgi:hypothetical protein
MHSQYEQTTAYDEDMPHERRGVKTRIIGVVMIILGVLNSLLTLRGGLPSEEYLILIATGTVIFAIGSVRSRRDALREIDHET